MWLTKIAARLFGGVGGRQQFAVTNSPKSPQTGITSISSREQYVGVKEDEVHRSSAARLAMSNLRRVEAQLANLANGLRVVDGAHGVREQELSLAARGIRLDGNGDCRTEQNAAVPLL